LGAREVVANNGPTAEDLFLFEQVFLLAALGFADIGFRRFHQGRALEVDCLNMLRQPNPESTELLGDMHPLVQQLGSAEGLVALSTASHSLQLKNVDSVASLLQFLEAYQSHILIPHELPAIQRAFRHASRNETRELVAFDVSIASEPLLRPFAAASRRVGQAQLKRLRPLRDQRLVQRYLKAVETDAANGWHTLVYGLTLSLYSLPVLQGLASYEKQTLLGFMHAVARSLRLSELDCQNLLAQLTPSLPRPMEPILGEDDETPRSKLSY
jgi:urease accessory protein UreF